MEDADVKQLISWIESAQLPYEIDESGTVIICDPTQVRCGERELFLTSLYIYFLLRCHISCMVNIYTYISTD